jgi:glycosyltransferase involved in cell wall biosynthesis
MSKPLLSICIPTKNHCEELRNTLESIVVSSIFKNTDKIEIVIADNCSDDNTQEVVENYCNLYGKKINYVRNPKDLYGSLNFEVALRAANGVMRKLHNSYFYFAPGAIDLLVDLVENFAVKKPVIFFTNGEKSTETEELFQCNDIDQFVSKVSFMSTWIGGFFVWEEDFLGISDFNKNIKSGISHAEFLLRVISSKDVVVVLNKKLIQSQRNWPRGGYNIAQIFGENYLGILNKYVDSNELNLETFEVEKKRVLLEHILPYYFSSFHKFGNENILKFLGHYEKDEYLYLAMISGLRQASVH